jgi:hypothetical protein
MSFGRRVTVRVGWLARIRRDVVGSVVWLGSGAVIRDCNA